MPGVACLARLRPLIAQDGLAAQAYLITFHRDHLHQKLVSLFELIANVADAVLGHLTDVQQAVRSWENFNEGAEVRQTNHLAKIRLADFRFRQEILNNSDGFVGGLLLGGSDVHATVIFHVDLDAGLFDDAADDFSARTDQFAYLRRVDAHRVDARSVDRNRSTRLRQDLQHLIQNVHAPGLRLLQGFRHELRRNARNLDIHLKRGGTVFRPGYFEVHVAVMVFGARDIRQDRIFVALLHQSHGDAGYRSLDGHARIHQRQTPAADRGHGR